MKLTFLLCLFAMASSVIGSNILVVLPFPAFSHTNSYMPIFTELAKRGNNVTMVSPFPQKKPIPNFHDIVLKNTMKEVMSMMNSSGHDITESNILKQVLGLWPMCNAFLDPIFDMQEFKEFLNDKNLKFDLVILEVFFCQHPYLAFGHKYGVPVISIIPAGISASTAQLSGNPNPVAYVPNMWTALTDHMTFLERVKNTFMNIGELLIEEFYGLNLMESYMRKHLSKYPGFENLPSISEMQRNISLFLLDNHLSLSYQRPYLPNIVEFGGLSIKSGGKLPEDLEKFMNESKDGVIFFTWGSHYKMTNMKPELLSAFMTIFGKLKQRVLMKWEEETLPGKPDNVKIAPWFPQASILAHPNIRLFITHGGIHGVSEATYHGVPLLGTPIFGDQLYNVRFLTRAGMALNVDIKTVTEDELFISIKNLLEDPKFKENALKRSLIMKDRPLSALDNAVYWVEYVLRHNGAHHLRPGSLDLTWYQNLLLDIAAAFALAITLVFFVLYFLTKLLCKMCSRMCKKNVKNKKD